MKHSSKVSLLKTAALVIALAFPALAGAAGADDAVSTRTDKPTAQQNGRDSVYALTAAPVYSAAQVEPQRYGRAGGYVGTDKVEVMKLRTPDTTAATVRGDGDMGRTDAGRMSGDRFDNPDSAHGQSENTVQTR
jgi:hypothetical protein